MSVYFFGQFLLQRGRITGEQLQEAITFQEQTNLPIGVLAVVEGFMKQEEADRINLLQRVTDKRFCELAEEQGLLTSEQTEELLELQRSSRILLGEALVHCMLITRHHMEEELALFKKLQEEDANKFDGFFADQPNAEVLRIFCQTMTTLLQRVAHLSVKIGKTSADPRRLEQRDYTARQDFTGGFNGTIGLALPTTMALQIGNKMLESACTTMSEDVLDGVAEFLNVVNGNVCAKFSGLGKTVDMQPPKIYRVCQGETLDFIKDTSGARVSVTEIADPGSVMELCVIDRS